MKALPPDTVRLLSSSQVITSVVNVVKELVENSLDAGSSNLEIKLENYGLDRIEVRDNGSGIKAVDAPVMALKHYTSKISCHEDLLQLQTYGFRGEALASICAVSEVVITTKTDEDEVSTQYTLDFKGCVTSQRPSHLSRGTTVCVLKLFKNLPVRRQCYSNSRKCREELKKVQDVLMAYAIIKPELRIVFTHNKVVVWQKSKVSDRASALMAVLGSSVADNLLPVRHRHEQAEVGIEGYFPKPNSDHNVTGSSTSDKTFIYVNDRPVNHKDILKLVKQYYSNSAHWNPDSASRRFPILMLNVSVPGASVDVNLTPDKLQVMFENKDAVLLAVESVLISLYGSYCVEGGSGEAEVSKEPEEPRSNTGATRNTEAGETSLPATANTSSSSSSEDWIINTSVSDSSFSENVPSNTESKHGEISAELWAAGKAFADPTTGERLEPVTLHQAREEVDLAPLAGARNVILEKAAKLTAYDLISSRSVRQPLSAFALYEQDTRSSVLLEKPRASLQDVTAAVKERWESLGEEERKKYEVKAERSGECYSEQKKGASCAAALVRQKADFNVNRGASVKRKAGECAQPTLDSLFTSPPQRKRKHHDGSRCLPFSMEGLRHSLQAERRSGPSDPNPRLVTRLPSHCAWLLLCGRKLMLLNPMRVEETLLFNTLLQNHILPTAPLQTPIQITHGVVGGPEYMDVLVNMEKGSPSLSGEFNFTDNRLVANGFQIRLTPASSCSERRVDVTAMADCMPFYGVADLREILRAVKERNAQILSQCRPLKVYNYLEGEAVRMTRRLPLNMSRDDVTNILSRMTREFEGKREVCLHGRPFFHHLTDVPETDQEALDILSSTC